MDNNYVQDIKNILNVINILINKELESDLCQKEYDCLYLYSSAMADKIKFDIDNGIIYER